jgi:alanine or glycine:cation symporter, AGCS family
MQNITFIEQLDLFLGKMAGALWDTPLALTLMLCGLLLTVVLGFPQVWGFRHAIQVIRGKYDNPDDPGEISHFQALCTALSATVGLGNIAGVAIAIHVGGPGATFWMIVCGLIGMATKFSECSLAVMFRKVDSKGVVHGGPMHYMAIGLADRFKSMSKFWRSCAAFFAIACIFSSFGAANMFQTNQVASIMRSSFNIEPIVTGVILAILTGIVIIGGIKRIAKVTEYLVPVMGIIYVAGALLIIFIEIERVPALMTDIFVGAFSGIAATGGAVGYTIKQAFVTGIRRACFSNEAGLGSAAIAHAAAATKEPIREGVVALLEPFIDTVIICTMTALVVGLSGAYQQDLSGVELTALAFNVGIPGFGTYFIPIAVFLFAYSTLISWSYYGERAVDYLFGEKGLMPYRILFCVFAFVGSIWAIGPVLNFSDIMLALMAAPNLIAVLYLLPVLKKASDEYRTKLKSGFFKQTKA